MKNLNLILTVAVLFLFAGIQVTSAQTKVKKAPVKTEQKVEKKEIKEMKPAVKSEKKEMKVAKTEMKSERKEVKSNEKTAQIASTKGIKGKAKVKAHHLKRKTEKHAAKTESK
jgi:hypothetical protein